MKTIIIYIMVFFSLSSIAQKKSLQLNLIKGETYIQQSNAKMDIQQEISGQVMDMVMDIGGKMAFTVTTENEAAYTMEVRFKELVMGMEMQGMTMKYSSNSKDSTDVMSSMFASMIDIPFEVVLTKQGKVLEVNNIESLYETMFEKFPEIPEAQKSQIIEQISQSYGETAFKGNIEMITAIFPESKIDTNDSWQVAIELNSSFKADVLTTYTLAEETDDYYLIKGISKIGSDEEPDFKNVNGMEMKYDLGGTMTSDVKIDKKSGWIIEALITQDISGDVALKPTEAIPEGMQWPMSIAGKLTITN